MKIFFILVLSLFGFAAQAQMEFGLIGGLRYSQAETNITSAKVSSRIGIQAGALWYLPFAKTWGLRNGFIYTQRYTTIENTLSGNVDVQYAYFDIPATLMFRFSDFAGVFAGPILAFNQSKDVTCTKNATCAAADVKSILLPWQAGVNFRFLSQVGGELYVEYVAGDLSTNVANMRTIGANVIFYFE